MYSNIEEVEALVKDIVKGIVSYPEAVETHVSVDEDERGQMTLINVKVHKADVGLCIGEKGITAESLRRIIGLIGFKSLDKRIWVKIDAPRIPKTHFSYESAPAH